MTPTHTRPPRVRCLVAGLTVLALSAGCSGNASPTLAPAATLESTTAATTTLGPTSIPTPSQAATIGQPADDGARIVAVESPTALQHRAWVDPGVQGCPTTASPGCWINIGSPVPTTRVRDLTIDSPAVGVVHARLLLPLHFGQASTAQWPVLYLHHGGDTDYRLWTEALDVTTLTAPTDLLVVMADGGLLPDGSIDQSWATFHLVELRQLLERNWQAGGKRAVAGMSMGGTEAMAEAESQPGFFRFAGSYSGGLDQTGNLAALAGTALYVAWGNGKLGPLDHGQPSPYDDAAGDGEAGSALASAAFVRELAVLKIPVTVYDYGNGTHNVPYWQRDFDRSFPLILKALGS
jgi:diacylglycerol O-acyltransferase / trehalose O-mycolyltransferase